MNVFVISDTHFPFHNKKAYLKMMKIIKKEKPDAVVQIGDLLDQYVFSKYSKSSKITPKSDIVAGLNDAKKMWADIRKLVPKAKCYQILGNHDLRIAKRISERLPELAEVYDYRVLYVFPGVKTMKSDRDYLILDDVVYCHGWLSNSIDHAKHFNKSTVHGHRHRPALATEGRLFSLDVGYLADETSLPLGYTASKYSKWKTSCGSVVDGKHPRLHFL